MATNAKAEKQITRIMSQGYTRAEAEELYKVDCEIDRGEPHDFDLPAETEKEVKKLYLNVDTRKRPTVYQFKQRERKPNATKGGLIAELVKYLTEQSEFDTANVIATNAERQIAFSIGNDNFELTLVQKRKPK